MKYTKLFSVYLLMSPMTSFALSRPDWCQALPFSTSWWMRKNFGVLRRTFFSLTHVIHFYFGSLKAMTCPACFNWAYVFWAVPSSQWRINVLPLSRWWIFMEWQNLDDYLALFKDFHLWPWKPFLCNSMQTFTQIHRYFPLWFSFKVLSTFWNLRS